MNPFSLVLKAITTAIKKDSEKTKEEEKPEFKEGL